MVLSLGVDSIWQMKKMYLREVEYLSQHHTAGGDQELNPGLLDFNVQAPGTW